MAREGVIKFAAKHTTQGLVPSRHGELACALIAWREILAKTRLIGRDRARYGDASYGNVSGRLGPPGAGLGRRQFLVTGTQTGGKQRITLADFCVITRYDSAHNAVTSVGLALPSSESMTHGALYNLSPQIRFVFHAHSKAIWRRAHALGLPTTDPQISYGTSSMAGEVARLYRTTALAQRRVLAMGGHEDGIIAFGHTAASAGQALVGELARACELACRAAQ